MGRVIVPLVALGVLALFLYVAFAPNVPHWVRQLFHAVIGCGLIGLVVAAIWAAGQVVARAT